MSSDNNLNIMNKQDQENDNEEEILEVDLIEDLDHKSNNDLNDETRKASVHSNNSYSKYLNNETTNSSNPPLQNNQNKVDANNIISINKYNSNNNNTNNNMNNTNNNSSSPNANGNLNVNNLSDYKAILDDLKKKGNINEKFAMNELETNIQQYIDKKFDKLESMIQESNVSFLRKVEEENLKLSKLAIQTIDNQNNAYNNHHHVLEMQKENSSNNNSSYINNSNFHLFKNNSKHEFNSNNKIYESILLEESKEEERDDKEKALNSYDDSKNNNINDKISKSIIKMDEEDEDDYYVSLKKIRSPSQITSSLVFIDDICGICSSEIKRFKYSCIICENLSLCELCERSHNHPLVKFKDVNLSNMEEVGLFLESNKSVKSYAKKYYDIGLFDKTYKTKLKANSHMFTMRPNTQVSLFLVFSNEGKNTIPEDTLILAKNNKDLYIDTFVIRDCILPKDCIECEIIITAGEMAKLHDIELFCFNKKVKLEQENLRLKVYINSDYEEEELNRKLYEKYPKLVAVPKEAKVKIIKVLEEGLSDKHPYLIYNALSRCGFNLEASLNYLYSLDLNSTNKH